MAISRFGICRAHMPGLPILVRAAASGDPKNRHGWK